MINGPQGTYESVTGFTEEYKQYSDGTKTIFKMFSKVKYHELPKDESKVKQTVLVLYLGGLTEAEISAVR